HPSKLCLQSVLLALVEQLRRDLEEPGRDSSRCCLRVLDVTGLRDEGRGRIPDGMSVWSSTVALAKACLEASRHLREFRKRGSRARPGSCSSSAA
ncbi:LRC14 protein, partial [Neodrepanis coruscans]|nr:LRC14 protein [Neodrepanis coruscans]